MLPDYDVRSYRSAQTTDSSKVFVKIGGKLKRIGTAGKDLKIFKD